MRPGNFLMETSEWSTACGDVLTAFTMVQLRRYREAQAEAQTTIGLDPGKPSAQFLLGYMPARRPETRKLSERPLLVAARNVPEAHLVLTLVFDAGGAIPRAREEIKRKAILKRPAK